MKVTFIGGGNMATALIVGMLRHGFAKTDIRVVEIVAASRASLTLELGVDCIQAPDPSIAGSDVMVLAVKPQSVSDAARELAPHVDHALVLSIAAGIRLNDLARWLGPAAVLARCMPNMPALVGAGITAVYARPEASASQREAAERVLSAVGRVIWIDEEALLDPVTALSGSGPAYAFYVMEAMQQAGLEMGLSIEVARALSAETMRGAAELAMRSSGAISTLRERVTSKGGTTERALAVMQEAKVGDAIVRAIHAANERARELAEQFGKN